MTIKKSYRGIAFLTALFICFSVLSGCAGNSGSNSSSTGSKNTSGNYQKPVYDLKGETVKFWSHYPAPRSSTIQYQSWKDVEKRYNCKIQFQKVDYQSAVIKMTAAALSGTAECDIWVPYWYNVFPSFISKNMVTPLSDYYEFENDPNWKDSDPKGNLMWAGKKYGLFEGAQTPTGGLWYNKALLKKENIVDPAELVKKNEWTWDKFLEMCKKLTKDTNGDGKTDQWGYYDTYLFENAIITNGGTLIDKSNPNKPKFNLDTEPNKRAIQWAYDLVKTYKVVPKVGTTDDMEMFGLFYNNKVAFFTYLAEYGPLCVNKGMNADDLGYTFFPKGPDAKDYYLHAPTLNIVYAITPQTKLDKKALTSLLADYLCLWDKSKSFAVEKSDAFDIYYTVDAWNGMEKIYENNKEFLTTGYKYNVPSYLGNFLIGSILNSELWFPLADGKIDIQSGITSVTPKIQAQILQMTMEANAKN